MKLFMLDHTGILLLMILHEVYSTDRGVPPPAQPPFNHKKVSNLCILFSAF